MSQILFMAYPKCTTCQKAERWLKDHRVQYENRHIVENRPTAKELKHWHKLSTKPLKSFFNTSGLVYKALALKDKLPQLDEASQLEILASDGMLVKRPLLIGENFVLIGFKEKEWSEKLLATESKA